MLVGILRYKLIGMHWTPSTTTSQQPSSCRWFVRRSLLSCHASLMDYLVSQFTGNVIAMFGEGAREHMRLYGSSPGDFAQIAYKAHRHSAANPYARNQKVYSMEQITDKRMMLYDPLTLPMACPTGDGGAAAVVCSREFMQRHRLQSTAVQIAAQAACERIAKPVIPINDDALAASLGARENA